jgi:RNA polymerase-binding transcription factor DksA
LEKRVTKICRVRRKAGRKASTDDILENSGQRIRVPRRWAKHFQRLTELRERLSRERGRLSEEAREEAPQYSLHMADAGTDSYDQDWALGMLSSEQNALYEVEQALDRIRNGTYGICEATGKKISTARLEAIPWTRFSAEAERQLEKERAVDTRRIGAIHKVPRQNTAHQIGEEQE